MIMIIIIIIIEVIVIVFIIIHPSSYALHVSCVAAHTEFLFNPFATIIPRYHNISFGLNF